MSPQTSASTDADCISTKKRPNKVVVHLLGLYVLYIKNEVLSLNYQGVNRQYPGFS